MLLSRSLALILSILFFLPKGYGEPNQKIKSPHVRLTLISEHRAFHTGTNWIGIKFELDPQWHLYWQNPGDSGAAPRFNLTLPNGVDAGEIEWPTPKRIPIAHLMNYGYEESVVLLIPINIGAGFKEDSLPIALKGEWLVCKEDCIPGHGQLSLVLPRNVVPLDRSGTAEFDLYRKKIPLPFVGDPLPFKITNSTLSLKLPNDLRKGAPLLLPTKNGVIKNSAAQTIDDEGTLSVTLESSGIVPESFTAVLLGSSAVEITLLPEVLKGNSFQSSLLVYIALAFIGGIILNLMPCVLPVIGIKVFSLIEHAKSNASLRRQYGILFLLGVLVSLWIIWGAVMIARSAGMGLGWGFQLQEPWFVILLVIVLLLLALNLLGLFEVGSAIQRRVGTLKGGTPYAEALLSGFLTTLVATPCTAPFMGTSIAFAFTADIASSFLVFTSLGLGLGLPYLAFCTSPSLINLLPRPGLWMVRLRQLLALPLLATAAWLLWIYALQSGHLTSQSSDGTYTDNYNLSWQPFSEARVLELRRENKIVFVDYTAAWCITCQVNKHVVFSSDAVRSTIKERGVILVRADWTSPDAEIEASIKSHGKAGVPLDIVYTPGKGKVILPTILTPGIVLEALSR